MSLNVAFYGLPGAFCEQALFDYFPNDITPMSNEKFEDVFLSLEQDKVSYGIVPIENSSTGPVAEIYDLLNRSDYYIVGEVFVKVEHHLLGIESASLESIEKVYSHPQAIRQSKLFLDEHHLEAYPYYSTAQSAAYVCELNSPHVASISSQKAAELYGLKILAPHINYNHTNTTRFVVLGKTMKVNSSCNKISVVLSTEHKAGALFKALKYFADSNINLLKIESRPVVHTPWEYYFYIDFEGNLENEVIKKAMDEMKKNCAYFKLLGNYKGASI